MIMSDDLICCDNYYSLETVSLKSQLLTKCYFSISRYRIQDRPTGKQPNQTNTQQPWTEGMKVDSPPQPHI